MAATWNKESWRAKPIQQVPDSMSETQACLWVPEDTHLFVMHHGVSPQSTGSPALHSPAAQESPVVQPLPSASHFEPSSLAVHAIWLIAERHR